MATYETNFDKLHQNVNAGLSAGLNYVPVDRHKRVVLASYSPLHRPKKVYANEASPALVKLNQAINAAPVLPMNNGVVEMGGKTIWSVLNPMSNADSYNANYRIDAQRHIESFMNFSHRARTLSDTSARFFGLDIETLGDTNSDKFFVSEISANAINMKNGKYVGESKRLRFNRLIAPDDVAKTDIERLIGEYQSGRFHQLNSSEQRTLVDLIRYSTLKEKGFTSANLRGDIQHHSLIDHVLHGKKIQDDELTSNINKYSRHMHNGLSNLSANKYGMDAQKAIAEYNDFLGKRRNNFFVTTNGDTFDLPKLQTWSSRVTGNMNPVINPKYHMDILRVIQATVRNPLDLHDAFGRVTPFKEGPLSLQELRETLGLSQEGAHTASADTGWHGVGGVTAKLWEHLDKQIESGQQTDDHKIRKLGQKTPYLVHSNAPLTSNHLLFATRALKNYNGNELDYQAEVANDGSYKVFRPGFNEMVINAESFYKVGGVRDLSYEKDGKVIPKWAMEFVNQDNDSMRSFVVREGDNAAYEIADFYHRNFNSMDSLSKKMRKRIVELNDRDKARRRYEGLFSLEDRTTAGYKAAKRMYGNAAVYEKFLGGKWSAMEQKGAGQVTEAAQKLQKQLGRGLTPEELQDVKYKVMGRLLDKHRMTKEDMHKELDFKSLWNPETKTWRHNEDEEKAFWKMLPRLMSERGLYQVAIDSIEKNITEEQTKSIAWSMFHEQVNEVVGDHKEIREPLPYEHHGFQFRDRMSGKNISVSLQDAHYAAGRFSSYVFKDTKEMSAAEKTAITGERFKTLLASLNDSGIIEDEYMQTMVKDFDNRNLAIPASIQKIAVDLMDNHQLMIKKITSQSLQRRKNVELISKDAGQQLINSVVTQAKGVQGYLVNSGNVIRPDLHSGDIGKIFDQLDAKHNLTGLNPNNRAAVERVIGSFSKNNPNMHSVLSMNKEGTQAIITMFNKEDSVSVTQHLLKGTDEAHPKAFEMVVPLVNRQGTLAYNNQQMNAVTDVIRVNKINHQISSSEKLAMMITDPRLMSEDQKWNYLNMKQALKDGDMEQATKLGRRMVRNVVQDLSGVKRDFDDDLNVRRNESDIAKQARVYSDSAMIQQYFENGELTEEDFLNKDVILNKRQGKLHPFVSVNDLTDSAKFKVRKEMVDWAKNNGVGDLYYSSVKSDVVIQGGAGRIDARQLLPYGSYTNMGRDNPVQMMNSYALDEDMTGLLKESSAWTNFKDGASVVRTEMQQQFDKVLPYDREVHIKAAMMTQAQMDKAVEELRKTQNGIDLLIREGILDKTGTKINPIRYPNVYEQQTMLNRDLVNRFQMKNYKYYRGDEIEWNKRYIGKDGKLRTDMDIKPGDKLGHRIVDGRKEDVFYDQKHVGRIASSVEDNVFAIQYKEQANKYTLDIEKVTTGGGHMNGELGYGQEFMEKITGVEGIGAIYNPDNAKHGDLGGALRGQANKIAYYVQQLNVKDRQEAAAMINRGRVGIKAEVDADGNFTFTDTTTDIKKYKNMPVQNFYRLHDKLNERFNLGISEASDQGVVWGVQALRASQVQTHSTMVDGKRKAILNYDINDAGEMNNIKYKEGETKGVKYGFRELGMLKQKGYNHTFDYILNHMFESADKTGRAQETIGMVHALRGITYGEEAVDPNSKIRTVRTGELLPLPKGDTNLASIHGTIMDDAHLREMVGENEHHGYWLEMPHAQIEGQKDPLSVQHEGRKINRVFVPFMKNEGKGNEIWKRELQQHISNIYRRSEAVNNAKTDIQRHRAMGRLQDAFNGYTHSLAKNVFSSGGQTGESVLKVNMPHSSSGLTKVLPTAAYSELGGGEHVLISPDEARALGVYDHIMGGKEFYVPDVRYPTFTDKAVQVSKLAISENVKTGHHHVTSILAQLLNADSDGDYNQLLPIHDDEVQGELKAKYKAEQTAREQRHQKAYDDAVAKGEQYPENYVEGEMKGAIEKETERTFALSDLASEGTISKTAVNGVDEMLAKSGKELVGQASDLNYMMRQIANHYYKDNAQARQAIFNLGEGLEQKLTISAKHGTGQVLIARNGASDMLSALRRGNWSQAIDIDKKYFADPKTGKGTFASKYDLEMAAGHLDEALGKMKNRNLDFEFNAPELRAGTSQGMRVDKHGLTKVMDTFLGKDPEMTSSNLLLDLLRRLMGDHKLNGEAALDIQYPEPQDITPEYRQVDPLEPSSTSPMKRRLGNAAGTISETIEDATGGLLGPKTYNKVSSGLDNFFSGVNGSRNKKAAAIGGLALAGIMGYNTLSDKDPVMPYNSASSPVSSQQARADGAEMYGGTPAPAMAPVETGSSGAKINISAQGKGSQNFGPMVGQAMQRSGHNSGKINMSVNSSDNTSKLNRIWYRDKVQQYS